MISVGVLPLYFLSNDYFDSSVFPNLKRHGNSLLVLPKLNLCFCVDSIWVALGYVKFSLARVNEAVETGVDANWGILQGEMRV